MSTNKDNMTQNVSVLVRLAIERDGVVRNALARGIVNTRALARDIEIQAGGTASFDAILSAIRRYPIESFANERKRKGLKISKLSLRNKIVVLSLKNTNELQSSILKFMSEIRTSSGEVFRLVTNMDTASVTVDAGNLVRLESFVPDSRIIRRLDDLAEIIVEMPIEIETTPGILAEIITELSINDIVVRQLTTIGPGKVILLVDERDATRAFDALEVLTRPEG